MFDHLDEMINDEHERTISLNNYFLQAFEAAKMMAQEIARHPETCIIWIFGDECDCGLERPQCETPEGR